MAEMKLTPAPCPLPPAPLCLVILLIYCISFSTAALAEEITLTPLVDVTAGYDDNVYYSRIIDESDYVATGRPGFIFDYESELFNVRSRGSMEILRYLHNSNLNRENYYAFFDGGVKLTERFTLNGNFSFVNDTTLDSQLEETGIVTFRTDRKRYNGGLEISYGLSEISSAGFGYNHQSTRYGSDVYEDYDYDYFRFFWNYAFNDGLDQLTVLPYYGYWRSDVSDVNNYGLSFGFSHAFSETFSLEVFAGPRYTQTERKYTVSQFAYDPTTGAVNLVLKEMKASDNNWGGTGSLQVKKRWESSSVTAGYAHELTYNSSIGDDAEPINVDRFYMNATHRIYRRLGVGFSGSYYISKSASSFGDQNRRYFTLTPTLNYDITRNYSLNLTYSYQRQLYDQSDSDSALDRNRVWITFMWKLPMEW
ncbi:putative uncharacterized protein, PEP-CTERM system associated [delta proteobacterium NaphS2]|nr:putative uncharacterized protein, PEP-CTERM system associated [delta proteobacterium NaphS2]